MNKHDPNSTNLEGNQMTHRSTKRKSRKNGIVFDII